MNKKLLWIFLGAGLAAGSYFLVTKVPGMGLDFLVNKINAFIDLLYGR